MLDLLTVGDIKLDTFVVLNEANVLCELKMPECKLCIAYGQKIPAQAFVTQIAGSAPNVAIGLAKMGLKTGVMSIIGQDLKEPALSFLKKHKVKTNLVKAVAGERSSAAVVLNFKGESTQLVDHVSHNYRLPKNLPATKYLYLSELGHEYETLYKEAKNLAEKGVLISLNPGTIQIKERKPELLELIAVSQVLFVNLSEGRRLVGDDSASIHSLIAKLKALGAKCVVITDGEHGAYAYDGQKLYMVPAFPCQFAEATGAGDAFGTGFLGALLKNKPISEALKYGAVNGASVAEYVGPTTGLLSQTEIAKRLKARPSFQSKEL